MLGMQTWLKHNPSFVRPKGTPSRFFASFRTPNCKTGVFSSMGSEGEDVDEIIDLKDAI